MNPPPPTSLSTTSSILSPQKQPMLVIPMHELEQLDQKLNQFYGQFQYLIYWIVRKFGEDEQFPVEIKNLCPSSFPTCPESHNVEAEPLPQDQDLEGDDDSEHDNDEQQPLIINYQVSKSLFETSCPSPSQEELLENEPEPPPPLEAELRETKSIEIDHLFLDVDPAPATLPPVLALETEPSTINENDGNLPQDTMAPKRLQVQSEGSSDPLTPILLESLPPSKTLKNSEGRFQCNQCPLTYTLRRSLLKHFKAQHCGLRYTCPLCTKIFTQSGAVRQHMRAVHKESVAGKLQWHDLGTSWPVVGESHLSEPATKVPSSPQLQPQGSPAPIPEEQLQSSLNFVPIKIECIDVDLDITTNETCYVNLMNLTQSPRSHSSFNFLTETDNNLAPVPPVGTSEVSQAPKIENVNETPQQPRPRRNKILVRVFECVVETCKKRFRTRYDLNKHYAASHQSLNQIDKMFKCIVPNCKVRYFATKEGFENHRQNYIHKVKKVDKRKQWNCEICSQKFGGPVSLKEHKFVQHQLNNSHLCNFCDKSFECQYQLKTHKIIDHGVGGNHP